MNLGIVTIPPQLPPPVKTYTLTLTEEEASYLRVITGALTEARLTESVKEGYDHYDPKVVRKVWDLSTNIFLRLAESVELPKGIGFGRNK